MLIVRIPSSRLLLMFASFNLSFRTLMWKTVLGVRKITYRWDSKKGYAEDAILEKHVNITLQTTDSTFISVQTSMVQVEDSEQSLPNSLAVTSSLCILLIHPIHRIHPILHDHTILHVLPDPHVDPQNPGSNRYSATGGRKIHFQGLTK